MKRFNYIYFGYIVLKTKVKRLIWKIENRITAYVVNRRCNNSRYGRLLWGRFTAKRCRENEAIRRGRYRRNMEVMAKVSEEYGIPQYKIRHLFERDDIAWEREREREREREHDNK